MPAVSRLGDIGSHGGGIATASDNVHTDGIPRARVGDIYGCFIHGPNPIVTGATDVLVNGAASCHEGSLTACGAVIGLGSPTTFVDGAVSPFVPGQGHLVHTTSAPSPWLLMMT